MSEVKLLRQSYYYQYFSGGVCYVSMLVNEIKVKARLAVAIVRNLATNKLIVCLDQTACDMLKEVYHLTEDELEDVSISILDKYVDDLTASTYKTANITGTNLRIIRKWHKLSMWKAAKLSGISFWELLKIERQTSDVYNDDTGSERFKTLTRLMNTYKISNYYLAGMPERLFFYIIPIEKFEYSPPTPYRMRPFSNAFFNILTMIWCVIMTVEMLIWQRVPNLSDIIPLWVLWLPLICEAFVMITYPILEKKEKKDYKDFLPK